MSYSILQKIQNSVIWESIPEGYSCRMRTDSGLVSHEVLTLDDLRSVHPYLPEMCEGMLAHRTENPSKPATTIMASWILRTLDLQAKTAKKLPATTGEVYLDKIVGIWETESPDEVLLKIYSFDTKQVELPDSNMHVEYAVNRHTTRALVHASWLDTSYPGWRGRLYAAQALELESEEVAQFVCEAGSALPASLNDLSFD